MRIRMMMGARREDEDGMRRGEERGVMRLEKH
jgi:hypothetical protein